MDGYVLINSGVAPPPADVTLSTWKLKSPASRILALSMARLSSRDE